MEVAVRSALGGALEGAERTDRETALWMPSMRSPDQVINSVKELADARGRDTVRNTGFAAGAVALHKDSIVGAQYRLNATPNWRVLSDFNPGFDEKWAEEFQFAIESRFNLLGDSMDCWLDASGMNTLTGMVRLAVGGFVITGEVVSVAEWIREAGRPLSTAIQMVSPDRLCNPDGIMDTRTLRRGVERNLRGKPLAYWFRRGDRYDYYPDDISYRWMRIPAAKPWGRKQVIHIIEQGFADQTRGVADMVAALKQMRMTKKFQEVTLQNAVVNATYAAAIESEMPPEMLAAAMGAGATGDTDAVMSAFQTYMGALGAYLGAANNIKVDGVMIPHLFPGTKLTLKSAGTPGGVGTTFEESLMRHAAATLGLSYEEFSRDFSKTNYSSARAAMTTSGRFMASRKRHVADRFASHIYALVLEEWMGMGAVPLPNGVERDVFYAPLMKEALTAAVWIGSGSGQVDELKETEAALLRIKGGLSTYEREIAKLGGDWREIFEQRAREEGIISERGLVFTGPGPKVPEPAAAPADELEGTTK